MRFSSKDNNGTSLRSAGRGGSGAPRIMNEHEGVDKGRGGNGTLKTSGGDGNGAPQVMRFSVKGGNREPSRSSGGGGNRAPIMMDKCERGDEGSNRASPPIRSPFINPYVKNSRPGRVRKGGG